MWLWLAGCNDSDPTLPPPEETVETSDTADTSSSGSVVWSDAPVNLSVHGWTFRVEVDPPATAEVRCTLDGDPSEVHTVRAAESGAAHDLVIYGLLASATYDCALEVEGTSETRTITTGPIAADFPSWTTTGETEGYTLLNHGTDLQWSRQSKLLIVDPEGRLRWSYLVPYDAADLDAQYLGGGQILYGGGYAAPPTVIDLAGTMLLQAPPASSGFPYNHHAERIDTGEVVSLARAVNDDGVSEWWFGFVIDILDPTLATRTWTWDSQRGYDEGWLPAATPIERDAYHPNAVQVDGDDVYVNLREISQLVKLDRVTGAHLWTLGPSGDFTLLDETGAPAPLSDWFWMPHAPEKHGDRILFYDNGVQRPGGPYTRVMELAIDETALTAQVVWSYTEPGWFEPIWGDVDRLPSGRVLFVRAHSAITIPALSYERTEIVEVDPATDTVGWRMSFHDLHDAGYRAERIDGCSLFANAKYCPP